MTHGELQVTLSRIDDKIINSVRRKVQDESVVLRHYLQLKSGAMRPVFHSENPQTMKQMSNLGLATV